MPAYAQSAWEIINDRHVRINSVIEASPEEENSAFEGVELEKNNRTKLNVRAIISMAMPIEPKT